MLNKEEIRVAAERAKIYPKGFGKQYFTSKYSIIGTYYDGERLG